MAHPEEIAGGRITGQQGYLDIAQQIIEEEDSSQDAYRPLNLLSSGVLIYSFEKKIKFFNKACLSHLKNDIWQINNVLTKPINAESGSVSKIDLVLAGQHVDGTQIRTPDGRWLEIYAHLSDFGKDDPALAVVEIHDVTRQNLQLKAIAENTARVEHDLKNPITAIISGSQLMLRSLDNPEAVRRYAEIIQRKAWSVSTQITEELNMADLELTKQVICAEDIISSVLGQNIELIAENGITASVAICDNQLLNIDVKRFSSMLNNLIGNAVRAMNNSPVKKLQIGTQTVSPDKIAINVSDTGKGIAKNDQKRIFNQFFTTEQDGTGLGLFISRIIARRHGGELFLSESAKGKTIFTVRMPAYKQ